MTAVRVAAPPRRAWPSTASAALAAATVLIVLVPRLQLAVRILRQQLDPSLRPMVIAEVGRSPIGDVLVFVTPTVALLALAALVLAVLSHAWTRAEKVVVASTPWVAAVVASFVVDLLSLVGPLATTVLLSALMLTLLGALFVLARRGARTA